MFFCILCICELKIGEASGNQTCQQTDAGGRNKQQEKSYGKPDTMSEKNSNLGDQQWERGREKAR